MKTAFALTDARSGAKRIAMGIVIAVAVAFVHQDATAVPIVDLGAAGGFAILAGSAITGSADSIIYGDVGLSPYTGAGITVLTELQVIGKIYAVNDAGPSGSVNDPILLGTAKYDLGIAYSDAAGRTANNAATPYVGNYNLALLTPTSGVGLAPGVYRGGSSLSLTGTLTLDAEGDPNAVWIFQMGSELTTAAGSVVDLINGAQACNVFWQVGSSATIGGYSHFTGNILAYTSITLDPYATLHGSALAQFAAVTLGGFNTITAEDCTASGENLPDAGSTLLLLSSGLAALLAFRRRLSSPA